MSTLRRLAERADVPASHTLFSWRICCARYGASSPTPALVDTGGTGGGEAPREQVEQQERQQVETEEASEEQRHRPQSEHHHQQDEQRQADQEEEAAATVAEEDDDDEEESGEKTNWLDLVMFRSMSSPLAHVCSFLDKASNLRLSRASPRCLVAMEHLVWHRLLGENAAYLRRVREKYDRDTRTSLPTAAGLGAGHRASVGNVAVIPPPFSWRQLFMRRLCRPWRWQTRKLVEGVTRIVPGDGGSYRHKFDCHLFEVVIVGYEAERLVREHCLGGHHNLNTSSSSSNLHDPAHERSSAYFTQHFYEDARPPYMETQVQYQGLVAQLQVSSQTMSTGSSGEYMCADAVAFIFSLNDKDGWRQIASVDIPLVESTIDPAVPRFIICVVDEPSDMGSDEDRGEPVYANEEKGRLSYSYDDLDGDVDDEERFGLSSSYHGLKSSTPNLRRGRPRNRAGTYAHDYYSPGGAGLNLSSQRSLYGGASVETTQAHGFYSPYSRTSGAMKRQRRAPSLKVGDAAAFARKHGFFFIEVQGKSRHTHMDESPAAPSATRSAPAAIVSDSNRHMTLGQPDEVDNVFFAIAATLLDNAKRALAVVHRDLESGSNLLGKEFMDRFTPERPRHGRRHDGDNDAAEEQDHSSVFASFQNEWFDESDSMLVGAEREPQMAPEKTRRHGAYSDRSTSDSVGEVPRKQHRAGSGQRHRVGPGGADVKCRVSCQACTIS